MRTAILLALSALMASGGPLAAQESGGVTMRTLLERTIFQVDVLTLEVTVLGPSSERLRELARSRPLDERAADSVAGLAVSASRARAALEFHRDVATERFLDAVRENSARAEEAGFISPDTRQLVERSLPEWYSFLLGRGIREGDVMEYTIRGDTLRTRYRADTGALLLDQTDVGPERPRAVLGGYFAPGSDFREGLIESLYRAVREGAEAGR